MTYGVQPTGFVRKPLPVILAEIEAGLITEFGPDVIQTSQSPLGQINGLMADLIAELWELGEATYQANDVDQAEGILLEVLGKIRLIGRASGESDAEYRAAISNAGRARNDVQDVIRALRSIPRVTYAQVFVNGGTTVDENGLQPGQVAVALIGGADEEVAQELRRYIVPGVMMYGNSEISAEIDGFCRSLYIIRPIPVPVELTINVRLSKDARGCPPPSAIGIRDGLLIDFAGDRLLLNGDDLTFFRIRSAIESRYPNVEVVSFTGRRDDIDQTPNEPVSIGFIEIATLAPSDVTVNIL